MAIRFLRQTKVLDWVAALFLFLLLREWLLPLTALTDTSDLTPFMIIVGGVLLLDLLGRWRLLTFLVKLAGVLWLLHAHYFVTPFWDIEWLKEVYVRIQHDIPLMQQQNWVEMSPVSRNALFYLMLLVLVSLLSYLVLEQRQGLWFVFLSEVYLATLDTFLPYEADGAIIRTLAVGFLLLAVLHMSALEKWMSASNRSRLSYGNSLLAPVMIITLTVGVAYAAPKQDASWPDPIAFLTSKNAVGTGYPKKVGYDNNDSRLGGPFIQDDHLVFIAITNEKTYWRGDAKDIYTGEGWQKGDREHEPILEPKEYTWSEQQFHGLETKDVTAVLQFRGEQFPIVFYPGQIKRLLQYEPENATLMYDREFGNLEVRGGKIQMFPSTPSERTRQPYLVPNTQLMKLHHYVVQAEVPILSEKKMVSAGTDYPEEIKRRYLQLPANLPPRIKQLTEKVTKDAKSPYEKARAVESFLRNGDYKYETEDVPIPENGQDFVDQFLFESYRGYCDHFSSAMAVMLRTIGIPTRWVKGFASGHDVGEDPQGHMIMEVRNKDAHSWVEVYFPGYGWIPFEPTSSFPSPVRVNYDLSTQQQQMPDLQTPAAQTPIDRGDGRLEELEAERFNTGESGGISWQAVAIFLLIPAVGALAAWRKRRQLFIWWLRRKMSTYQEQQFPQKYQVLLTLFEKTVAPRKPGETLREYVRRLTIPSDKRQDLFYLTQLFERVHYGYKEIEEKARGIANKLMEQLSQQLKP
ncbi:transglutaminase domain-containing protein [Brevibacillus sp. SYP-B805]|uniref:DUF4129 domain-containing transglutaminase family protein n=1 Tax=Brevibacillus sp. SYP-B805 TaxID=1578199 RepID=UPI0013EB5CC9|nr:transglutaminase domain-containing protein [Brevibacillus sp. SYP-B805]NGQ97062.1 transglutaminase domain-containing protein [Brevibacillus sp. SYP-B805]